MNGTFVWENVRTERVFAENSDTLTLNILATDDFGTYHCTVTNAAQATGSGNVAIEQGCKLMIVYIGSLGV